MFVEVFDAPVFVKTGKRIVREVGCVSDAADFLVQWIGDRHDVRAEALLRACVDVQNGNKPVSVVSENFITFARLNGIWENPETVMPWIETCTREDCIPA
ncbi:MAG: DUF982 domain-containing protein [Aurantimonas endophytica]|uniref:DUF982 domain-containing protein n=1 Tax=Aurantimonas endophytica TaxID=1522175 RepID=UPI0030036D8D